MALGTPAATAGALAYARMGSRIAGNLATTSASFAAGSSHSTGKLLGVARLAHRMNPSHSFGSIVHTRRRHSALRMPSVNSRSPGATVSAWITAVSYTHLTLPTICSV